MLNLLSNANKFSSRGDVVNVRLSCRAGYCEIEVRDHGIGISIDDQVRIFEEFEQVKQPGSQPEGTGLGLALARRFVEAHRGEISVESQPGMGATFRVTLPRA
jgi:signal transduction histidine kinase